MMPVKFSGNRDNPAISVNVKLIFEESRLILHWGLLHCYTRVFCFFEKANKKIELNMQSFGSKMPTFFSYLSAKRNTFLCICNSNIILKLIGDQQGSPL